MAKPIVYFQGTNSGVIPSTRDTFRWTEETELGTTLTGDGNTTGLNIGSLTNNQSSSVYDIIISHNAIEPVTNVKFYFANTTVNRSGGTGFTSTADILGAQADFNEIRQWGTDSFANTTGSGPADGMFLKFKNEAEDKISTQFRTGFMDELSTAKPLSDLGKGATGGSPDAIQPFNNFAGPDYAHIQVHIFIPESLEEAGKRQLSLVTRLTYSF